MFNHFTSVCFHPPLLSWCHIYSKQMSNKVLHSSAAAAAAKSHQSCPTLCDPIDGSPPGSTIPGILQARTLEWVAISFSSAGKRKVKVKSLSRVWLLATPGTAALQVSPSMGFSRQEYWCGVPLPSPLTQFRLLLMSLTLVSILLPLFILLNHPAVPKHSRHTPISRSLHCFLFLKYSDLSTWLISSSSLRIYPNSILSVRPYLTTLFIISTTFSSRPCFIYFL